MKARRIKAVMKKQMLNTPHNIGILIQFSIFPLIMLFLTLASNQLVDTGKIQVVLSLSTVFTGLTPMLIINSIIHEDRVTNTLRMLIMSTVKPMEYFIGINTWILCLSLINIIIFGIMGSLRGLRLVVFVCGLLLAILTTLMLGSLLAAASRRSSQLSVAFINILSILNGMLPLFASGNRHIHAITKYWYMRQVSYMMGDILDNYYKNFPLRFTIIGANLLVFYMLFMILYKKQKIK